MIELERHIEILLLRHDCVILPGFGGFMTHHVEARYDEAERLFLPPLRTVGFNPSLKMNDSLLVQSYIEVYDISYPEALRRIEDEVDELRQRLSNEGSYELRNIGTLSVGEDGNYLFEPCEAGILTPSLYGLSSYEMPLLSDAEQAQQSAESAVTEPKTEKPQTDTVERVVPGGVFAAEAEDEDDNRFIRLRVSLVRNVAAACIALIAFFAVSTPLGDSSMMLSQSKIDTSLLDKLLVGETTVSRPMPVASNTVALKPEPKRSEVEPVVSQPKEYFCIVLASKVTKTNAQRFVERLRAQGLTEASVLTGHGATKVVYGNYASEKEAQDHLHALSGDVTFKDGWIFQVIRK